MSEQQTNRDYASLHSVKATLAEAKATEEAAQAAIDAARAALQGQKGRNTKAPRRRVKAPKAAEPEASELDLEPQAPEQEAQAPKGEPTAEQRKAQRKAKKRAARKKGRRVLAGLLAVLLTLCVLGFGGYLYVQREKNTLEVTFYHLQSDHVSAPFRIVQLSDLHLKEFGEKNAELIGYVRALQPDAIVITGDMNNHYNDDVHVVTDLCSQLVEIVDVYYVFGNHEWVDHIHRHTDIKAKIEATGVHLLENSFETVTLNGTPVVIGGLVNEVGNYETYDAPAFMEDFMAQAGFKLLLVHYPEYFLGKLNGYEIDLAMCGHTHGGIVRIPKLGGLYSTDQGLFPELYEGMQTVPGGSTVVVSRGLGGDSKIPRINNNPELVVVDVSWY